MRIKWSSILMIVVLLWACTAPAVVYAEPPLPIKAQAIAAGIYHSMILKSDGTVIAWGDNYYGQTAVPAGLSDVKAIATGGEHSLALKSDGTVVAWGRNDYGQAAVPADLKDVRAIAAGGYHSLALKTDGTVVAWGRNDYGQAAVPAGYFEAIAAGGYHSLALKTDGIVVAWGDNTYGQAAVPAGYFEAIAAGGYHSLALKTDGTVVGWGYNEKGQVTVPAGTFKAIAAGGLYSLALKIDGTVIGWGYNENGQATVPEGLSGVVAIAAGTFHSLALKTDGTVVAWGDNSYDKTTVPGSADLSGLSIDVKAFSPSFDSSVSAYTAAYVGTSTTEAKVTATLADTVNTALYINGQAAASGAATAVPLTGTVTDITVRTEPYFKTGKTYTITVRKDAAAPEVSFGTNGSETWSALAASAVTVTDTEGGVDPASLKYAWSTDTAVPASGWTSFGNGETLIKSGSDGDWYLHIQAADALGNTVNEVSSRFRLDNTATTISLLSPQGTNVPVSVQDIVLGFSEAVKGVENKKVTVSDGTDMYIYTIAASDNNISVIDSVYRAAIPVTRFVKGTEPLSFKYNTEYSIDLEAGAYTDAAGNGKDSGNIGSFRTEKKTYIVAFKDLDDTLLSTQTITEGGKAVLPASPTKGGYTFAGWHSDKAYTILFDFNTVIAADRTVYAKWTQVKSKSKSSDNEGSGGRTAATAPPPRTSATVGGNTVTIKTTVDGSGRAAAALTQGQITEAIGKAIAAEQTNGSKAVVEIRIEAPASVKTVEASLPKTAIEAVAGSGINELTLTTPIGTISFDAEVLDSIAGQVTSDVTFSVGRVDSGALGEETRKLIGDRPVYDFSVKSGGRTISQFAGQVTVSIPYKPTAEELANPDNITVWYIDGTGNVVPVPSCRYDASTGKVTYTTTHFSKYAVVYVKKSFEDLGGLEWAKKQIEVLASKGIMEGRTEKGFAPKAGITRAEYIAALVRAVGVTAKADTCFNDVAIGSKYYEEIAIAKKLGISNGTGSNSFRPEETITRQDMLVLTERALRSLKKLSSTGTAADLERFTDRTEVGDYAIESIAALINERLIEGSSGKLNVKSDTTRAEAAVFLYRIYNR